MLTLPRVRFWATDIFVAHIVWERLWATVRR